MLTNNSDVQGCQVWKCALNVAFTYRLGCPTPISPTVHSLTAHLTATVLFYIREQRRRDWTWSLVVANTLPSRGLVVSKDPVC